MPKRNNIASTAICCLVCAKLIKVNTIVLLYTVVGTGSTGTVNELVALIITYLSD